MVTLGHYYLQDGCDDKGQDDESTGVIIELIDVGLNRKCKQFDSVKRISTCLHLIFTYPLLANSKVSLASKPPSTLNIKPTMCFIFF